MFQIPAYDPVAIVMMGFRVVLAAGFAFVLCSPFDFRDPPRCGTGAYLMDPARPLP